MPDGVRELSHHWPDNCSDKFENRLRYGVGATRAIGSPAIVILGLLGNALTIAIFSLEARLSRWNRFGIWCVALAISDSSVLIFSSFIDDFLGRGLAHIYGSEVLKLDASHPMSCRLLEYMQHSTLFASSYLLVIFSADRLLTVSQPMRMMTHRYVTQSVAAAVSVAVLGLILMSPVIAVYGLETAGYEDVMSFSCRIALNCTDGGQSSSAAKYILYFKAFGIFVAPCLLQAALSAAIVAKLIQVRRLRRDLLPGSQDKDLAMSRYYANLAVSITFCLLSSPLCVVIVMRTGCGLCEPRPSCRCHVLEQAAKLLDSVKDISYAINFWVYLIFVRSFRRRVQLALAFAFVRLRLVALCPNWSASRAAAEMVDRLEMKRNPGVFQSQAAVAAAAQATSGRTGSLGQLHMQMLKEIKEED
uniref:G_PROTEIN_RECEP_F1_2 domain-containing protein n=1 Tax=Macrostomum lignano TaxID=282301 RepID=A0A1I8GUY8_9PLAT